MYITVISKESITAVNSSQVPLFDLSVPDGIRFHSAAAVAITLRFRSRRRTGWGRGLPTAARGVER